MTTATIIDHIMDVMEGSFEPAFREAWNRRQITDALAMPTTHAILIDPEGKSVKDTTSTAAGFVLTRAAAGEEELLLIAVLPEYRGRGLAQRLIEQLFDAAKTRDSERIYLEMRRGNTAIHLYRKLGFKPIGERRNYYRMENGERIDAITFGRSI
ncbi:MAG: GNAT family N-acetyltransferase [Pseudomonadota bacterium]